MHKTIKLGKVAYTSTRRMNWVEVEVELADTRLSISGGIWNARGTDYAVVGQCIAEIDGVADQMTAEDRALWRRIRQVWKRWHLNDMRAGSPRQEEWLRDHPVSYTYLQSHYDAAVAALTKAGLYPDTEYLRNGEPYRYGSAWLFEPVPAEILREVEEW